MRHLNLGVLAATSSAATVARSSRTQPDFLLASDRGDGLVAARWRRRRARLPEPQRLDDHVLSYCVSGRAESTIVVSGVATRLQHRAGSITFIPAGQPVQWSLDSDCEAVHLHVYIAPEALRLPLPGGLAPALRASICDPWLDAYFRLLIAELERCLDGARLGDSAFLDETAGLLMRQLRSVVSPATAAAPKPAAAPSRVAALRPFILHRIEDFVDANLARDIHLGALADVASMSVGHFLRAFHSATGATPYQYLLERRLDRACALLRDSTDLVSAIALRCGYRRASHFASIFHVHRGCTPTQYRRRY